MKVKNLSALARAAGILEGMAADEKIGERLMKVVKMLDAVVIDEERTKKEEDER